MACLFEVLSKRILCPKISLCKETKKLNIERTAASYLLLMKKLGEHAGF